MTLQDVTFEAGFGSTMFDGSPSWTDITAYVRQFRSTRGRTSVEGRFDTGTAFLVVDNRDGRFTPDNTAGAYYPNVLLGVPIRVVESDASEPIFYGSVRGWPPSYPKTQDSYATVPLADGFYNLNLEDLHGETYSLESTDERITSVLDDISWPAGLRDLDAGVANVQATSFGAPQDGGEQPVLQHLLDVAEAEVGHLFMSRDGNVTFKNRVAQSGASASVNLTDANMQELTVSYDDDHFFNDIRVAREDGAQITYVDATSVSNFGRRVLTRDVMPMATDAEALNVAEWLSYLFGEQRLRIDGLKLKMYPGAPHYADVLGLELRDYINVNHVPPGGDTLSQDCSVEGIRHEMTPGDWTVYLTVAPLATVETQSYWILGTSALDVSTRLA